MNQQRFLELISHPPDQVGERLLLSGLRALSWGYGAAMRFRNTLFDAGLRRVHLPPLPVISIGNVTTGGTGKTPLVALLVELLQRAGRHPGIVSRGYRAAADGTNDEWKVLQVLCPGIPHLQNRDRVAAVRELSCWKSEDTGRAACDVVVADDAFQHRRLGRTLDIVLIDALNPFGFDALLPRGLLREPLSGLKRADLVILTRADLVDEPARAAIWQRIERWKPRVPHIEVQFQPTGFLTSEGTRLSEPASRNVLAFCGIGHPEAFRKTLAGMPLDIRGFRAFQDHHHYRPTDVADLIQQADRCGATALVTTLKDLVKIEPSASGLPVLAIDIRAGFLRGCDDLIEALRRLAS